MPRGLTKRALRQVNAYLNDLDGRTLRTRSTANSMFPFWDDLQESLVGKQLAGSGGKVGYDWGETAIVFQPNGNIANDNDCVIWNLQLRHGIKVDSELHLHMHFWKDTAVNREMTLRYRFQVNGSPKTTAWTTVTADTDDAVFPYTSGVDNNILPLATIDLTGMTISDIIQFRMTRTDGNSGDLFVTFADGHAEWDALGSRTEYVK